MIGFNVYKAPPYLLEKINNIYSLLRRGKKEYEQVATTTADKDLRRTMLSLAQGSNQYACELSSQIHTLGGTPEIEKINEAELTDEIKNLDDENKIITLCEKNEKKMINAYREILNDSFLHEGLKKNDRLSIERNVVCFHAGKTI